MSDLVTHPNPLPVRSPLDLLRLDCPQHQITRRPVADKLFYLAEATATGVQPWFAQAETVAGLRAKLQVPLKEFTVAEPSIPRVWDYLLGGKENFTADRGQARKLLTVFPRAAELSKESREFQRRAVAYVASAGVWQFLDLGCGLPTSPATHEVAQQAQPGSVVAYVDNDELVMSHARSLLARAPGVLAVAGDLAHPEEILYDWHVRQAIDFHQPIAAVLTMSLHFFDAGRARTITRQLAACLPAGSYIIMSTGQLDGEIAEEFSAQYAPGHLHHHTRDDLAGFLAALELIDPGVTEARLWRPSLPVTADPRRGRIWAALARTPMLAEFG